MNVNSQVIQVTIPAGATESAAFDVGGAIAIALVIEEAFTWSELELLVAAGEDGPYYSVLGGIVLTSSAAGVLSIGDTDAQGIRPFRWMKLRIAGNEAPDSTLLEALSEAADGAGTIEIDPGAATSGYLVAGDTFTVAGHPAPYTVTTPGPLGIGGDTPSVAFTPVLDDTVPLGTTLTFAYVGARGEAAARSIQVVTK